jgi:GTP-binding protein
MEQPALDPATALHHVAHGGEALNADAADSPVPGRPKGKAERLEAERFEAGALDAGRLEAGALDAGRLEAGRWLFAQECRFVAGAAAADAIPPAGLPEIAFAGRSNVGKSSLVNALTGQKALARISHTPGRTRQLNFFALGRRLMLVDLPGYGYARAAKEEVKAWTGLTRRYLKGRPNLSRVMLLIDARHGLKEADRAAMELMDQAAVSYQLVLTKCDKLRPDALAATGAAVAAEAARHRAAHPEIPATSAVTGAGLPQLRGELARLALDRPQVD